ncbi:hypothetical protein QZH56_05975 [Streptomyces olivoreticuli]|uniref:hypothetical protein n=1 Tax=Streptomyces olivoreticuli TaxID=68246 RepID=UPI00265870E2|nr:hypothetical protein [Streptomyces olivoreticuli]WKK25163.1 hypothetical protein QZH56_05975 [Streptomyces olivoreticuli]
MRRTLTVGAIGSASLVLGVWAMGTAVAAPAPTPTEEPTPPSAVETFDYPNAAKILKEQGIALRKGDGHILLADCKVSRDIQIMTSMDHPGQSERGLYCFKVTGTGRTGYLTLEIPKVYNIMTGDVAVRAGLTAEGQTQTVTVPKNDAKGVGTAGTPPTAPTVLVELRVTS